MSSLVPVYLSFCLFTEGSPMWPLPIMPLVSHRSHDTLSLLYLVHVEISRAPGPQTCFQYAAQISVCERVVSIPVKCLLVTARNKSCGMVMFSQTCVSHSAQYFYLERQGKYGPRYGIAPPPRYWHVVVTTEADGTLPTEMHSCILLHIPSPNSYSYTILTILIKTGKN